MYDRVFQEGLKARQSRMDVDLPFAAQLGVELSEEEKAKKEKKKVR